MVVQTRRVIIHHFYGGSVVSSDDHAEGVFGVSAILLYSSQSLKASLVTFVHTFLYVSRSTCFLHTESNGHIMLYHNDILCFPCVISLTLKYLHFFFCLRRGFKEFEGHRHWWMWVYWE